MAHETTPDTIGAVELAERVAANSVFLLDLRRGTHGEQIYGAIRYDPHKLRDAPRLVLPLPKDDGMIVLYDDDGTGRDLATIAAKLRDDGYGEIRVLEGGFDAWRAADGKTEGATIEQPVPLVSTHQAER